MNNVDGITDIEFEAVDADSEDFGQCEFRIETDNDTIKEYIEISQDGKLKVLKPMTQIQGVWKFNLTVSDMGQPPLSSWKMINLDIKDVNDEIPVFTSPQGTVFISDVSKVTMLIKGY